MGSASNPLGASSGNGAKGRSAQRSSGVSPPKGSWANVVAGSKTPSFSAPRMNLKFVPPENLNGLPRVVTAASISAEGAKKWATTLVGCFVGGSLPFSAVNNIARNIWSSAGLKDVLSIEKGFFLFRFGSSDGMVSVVEKGPWLFAGRYMVLRKWSPGLPLSKANLHSIPVWAKFYNIPIELWTEEGLSHIASAVGKPLYADSATEACSRIQFARICVEVEAHKPLVDQFEVEALQEDGSSSVIQVSVGYQWRPPLCEACQVFGHSTASCQPAGSVPPPAPQSQDPPPESGEGSWHLVENRKKASGSKGQSATEPSSSSDQGIPEEVPGLPKAPVELLKGMSPIQSEVGGSSDPISLTSSPQAQAPTTSLFGFEDASGNSEGSSGSQPESHPGPEELLENQDLSPRSSSPGPLLNNKLVARLKNIDGPISIHLVNEQQSGEPGKTSRTVQPSQQPLLLTRRTGAGGGGGLPTLKK